MMICPYCKKEIEPVEETTSQITTIKDEEGRVKTWTEETRDADNILLAKRIDDYKYFAEIGDIDTIIQKVYDGEATLLSKIEIKHSQDGGQPVIVDRKEERSIE